MKNCCPKTTEQTIRGFFIYPRLVMPKIRGYNMPIEGRGVLFMKNIRF